MPRWWNGIHAALKMLWPKALWVRFPPWAPKMHQVYILKSLKDFRTYVGHSEDVVVRLAEHNSGKVKATFNRRPLEIIYTEDVVTLKEAKAREKYWKSGVGRRKLKQYFKEGFPPRS